MADGGASTYIAVSSGAWLSLVEHRVWDAEVGGSNPPAPIGEPGPRAAAYDPAL
jgi:hypothetical protein